MDSLINIIIKANRDLNIGTRLGWCFRDVNGERLLEILSTINICNEPFLRKAKLFVIDYNKDSDLELKFKRDYSNYRGSELLYEGPIFYIDSINLNPEEVTVAAKTVKNAVEKFYESLMF